MKPIEIHRKTRFAKLTKLFCSGNESHMTKYYFVIWTKLFVVK